jgi:uncharacterized protein
MNGRDEMEQKQRTWVVTFSDHFSGDCVEEAYEQLLGYLEQVVENADVDAFEFTETVAEKQTVIRRATVDEAKTKGKEYGNLDEDAQIMTQSWLQEQQALDPRHFENVVNPAFTKEVAKHYAEGEGVDPEDPVRDGWVGRDGRP